MLLDISPSIILKTDEEMSSIRFTVAKSSISTMDTLRYVLVFFRCSMAWTGMRDEFDFKYILDSCSEVEICDSSIKGKSPNQEVGLSEP